jgi:CRP-like cAMP-binding protein
MSPIVFQNLFARDSYIVRQGTSGDTFYIIGEGKVRVTKRSTAEGGGKEEELIRTLSRGDYFGEQERGSSNHT